MKLNIALIGYKFMGKAHSYGIDAAPFFFKNGIEPVKKVICGRTEHLVKQAAEDFGWEEYCTDWQEIINRDDIDVVDIATPTINHKEIAIAAMKAGKHVFCEKPLSMNAKESKEMMDEAKKAGIVNMLGHNYRRCPAAALAKNMIAEGKLGKIYHVRAVYLQDWIMDPNFPAIWKLNKKIAGSGPHGDLNAHIIDLARFMTGDEIDEVVGMKETFIKQRPAPVVEKKLSSMLKADGSEDEIEMVDVTVEDACSFLAKFKNGALGTFESTRFAGGRKNFNRIEINGEKGTIIFEFEDMNRLQYFNLEDPQELQGFKSIMVTEDCHPYIANWWPPGHIIGYENTFVNEFADFFKAIKDNEDVTPNFYDGWKGNQVLDAVMKSTETRTWQKVDDM
ncbi:MAG: Gfo/Idh/MocA family oxidoreductase [Vallitalea sp.]|jgi:predicted dehydrogenase|nr:Gfo/Idh/MocA family oxidoreductase [Vallitalea sp.]